MIGLASMTQKYSQTIYLSFKINVSIDHFEFFVSHYFIQSNSFH